MKKVYSLILVLSICAAAIFAAVSANAADKATVSFNAQTQYKASAAYADPINTFEAVINLPENFNSSTRGGVIIGNYGYGNPNVSFEIHNSGRPRLYITEPSGNVTNLIFNQINVATGKDTHIAIVRDAAAKKAYCYIDGELRQTLDCAYTGDIIAKSALVLGGDLRTGNEQYFKGEIKSVALYSDAHSATDVKHDFETRMEYTLDMIAMYDLTSLESEDVIPDLSGRKNDVKLQKLWFTDKEPVSNYAYSFAIVGDTQIVAKHYPDKFHKIYDYILDNIEEKNIQFVMGLGDITDGDSDAEWSVATENIFRMDGKVRYSLVRGNHDSTANFTKAFPYSTYEDLMGGSFDGTMLNTWQELVVGEHKYLIFTLDYGASGAVLKWAGNVIDKYPDHKVILTTHAYLFRDGTTLDSGDVCPPASTGGYNNGDHMWELLMKNHKNIVMVISGHDPCNQIIVTQEEGVYGNTVTQMLVDPQGVDSANGGVGLVAMLYFSEDGKTVTVDYYSTIREEYFMSENQFTFTLCDPSEVPDSDLITDGEKDENKNDSDNKKPSKQTEAVTDAPEESLEANVQTDPVDTSGEKTGGCGSTIGFAVLVPTLVIASGCVVGKKRREKTK